MVVDVATGLASTVQLLRVCRSTRIRKLGVEDPGLKTGESRVLKVQQKKVCSTGFRVSSPEIFI